MSTRLHLAGSSLLTLLLGCTAGTGDLVTDDDDATDSWSEESHGEDAAPDFDRVFASDVVQRIDLVFATADYDAVQANLDEVASGGPGGGPGGGGPPPPAAFTACDGLEEGDACSYDTDDGLVEGSCLPDPHQDGLICVDAPGELVSNDPLWVPITVRYDDRTWEQVGFRYKGNSSLRFSHQSGVQKLPFRLEADQFEDDFPETDDQRLYGFEELTFAPGYVDSSFLHDTLALEILDGLGVPAARTSFYEVYADHGDGEPVYWGLFTMIEDPSDTMMERVYGDDSGNLYKPDMGCGDWTCFDTQSFVTKSNQDTTDHSDVEAALDALHSDTADAAAWRQGLEATLDVPGFLRWLAINTVLVNWDAYGMTAHNYYLYGVPDDGGRLAWIPWDNNEALEVYPRGEPSLSHDELQANWPLIRLLLDDPEYAETYRQELARTLEGPFEVERFVERAAELHELIRPSVEAEEAPYTQLPSQADFEGSVDDLEQHAQARHDLVEQFLSGR